jgi:hypothetical protein
MKTFLFVPLAATLLTATSAFAAPLATSAGPAYPPFDHDHDRGGYNGYNQGYRPDYHDHDHWGEGQREAPRYDRDQAYGYQRQQYDGDRRNGYYQNQGYGYAGNQQYGYSQRQYYGYDRAQRVIVQPQPQYRRPAVVSFRFGGY